MSLEVCVGLAFLTQRRLSLPWDDPISEAPGPRPASSATGKGRHPTITDLWEVPVPIVSDDEWRSTWQGAEAWSCDWGHFGEGVCVVDRDSAQHPHVAEFANGRTKRFFPPLTDQTVAAITGRPLVFPSYFFYALGEGRQRLFEHISRVQPLPAYRTFGAAIGADLGVFNVAHIRRTDLTRLIRSYAAVSPTRIAASVEEMFPAEELLVVATEADPGSSLFDPLRERFRSIVFLNDLILGDHGAGFRALPWTEDNALGLVTQEVALAARGFIGTIGSTFSALIHRERRRRNPGEAFRYTVDHTPPGPCFKDHQYVDRLPGRYSWNRIGMAVDPRTLSWFREWPEAIVSPDN